MPWRAVVLLFSAVRCSGVPQRDELDFSTVDVGQLATHTYGTELFLLENRYREQTAYKFEDFFWTGSGDGPDDEGRQWDLEGPTTVYKTTTVVTTMFIESPQTLYNETSKGTTTPKCPSDCSTPPATSTTFEEEIKPSPAIRIEPTEGLEEGEFGEDFFDADRQFWLLTVLKSDGKDPVIIDLKNSLAKLYKTAFQRQQERHLGITNNSRIKRAPIDEPVNVYIRNLTKMNGDGKIEVLYHVSVAGKPVSAITAANDMHLVSDEEVRKELGYPFLVKAEPYLKPSEPQGLSSAKNTWMFIGISIVGFLVFLLVLAFLLLGCKKKKRVSTPISQGTENRQHIFERGVGHDNKAYELDENRRVSPTYINYKRENSTARNVAVAARPGSSISSTSSSSVSLDISPLMHVKKHHRTPPKKPPRPRAALNKTAPMNMRRMPLEVFDSDGSSSRKESPVFIENYDPGVMSPKSYLSMPSVKSFPRDKMPVPLNKVLEPISILHLDMIDDQPLQEEEKSGKFGRTGLVRHGSLGAVEDPGVIGPIVWNSHCQKLQHGVSVDEGMQDLNVSQNVSKMRKRFHDLLDDTFSLFGSRKGSPVDKFGPDASSYKLPIEVKSHSAANTRSSEELKAPTPKPRPKTTDLRKVDQQATSGPKGAWSSKAPSPLVRPLSAGIINPYPRVNVGHVLAEGQFQANDPAIPLIAAIKSEIERVSLPGSTADLHQ
ncbi:hypothetical protein JTB14_000537 [Gonioctena quinquepunctata]|nr:hypothetical protein JTB14_000537 [Gonioctena quinquepunctata]